MPARSEVWRARRRDGERRQRSRRAAGVRGSASPRLTKDICGHLGVAVGLGEVLRFSEGNLFVRVLENVRGRHVYLVQSTVYPANDHFMELLFWIDAFKRASAASVTAVVPYFSYTKETFLYSTPNCGV